MVLEQQPLDPVANLLPRGQDEITWLPGLHEAFPPEATRKRLSHLQALDPVGLKADLLLVGLEKRAFGSVVYLDLFVIDGMPAEPVVWHFSGDWGRLPLIATADVLDAPYLKPVEEVGRVGQGTVQTSSQMITRGTNFCPILSGVQSVWPLQRKKL